MDKITKISQAIRIGAKLHPKAVDSFFRYRRGQIVSTCALGAAIIATFGEESATSTSMNTLRERFPELEARIIGSSSLYDWILTRNDVENISREEIADQLEKMGC